MLTVIALLVGFIVVPRAVTVAAGTHRLSISIAGAILGDLVEIVTVLAIVTRAERRPVSSLGLRRPPASHLGLAAVIAVVGTAIEILGTQVAHTGGGGLHRIATLSIPERALLVITVSIAEALVYRGMLISRLRQLTGSAPLAVVLSSLVFAAAHVQFFGVSYFIVVAAPALLVGGFFAATDDLPACMLIHLLTDLPILLLT